MKSMTISSGAVAMAAGAHTRVWPLQPATRRVADLAAPVQGTTLPVFGSDQIATNYMDVDPFRTGRPPV